MASSGMWRAFSIRGVEDALSQEAQVNTFTWAGEGIERQAFSQDDGERVGVPRPHTTDGAMEALGLMTADPDLGRPYARYSTGGPPAGPGSAVGACGKKPPRAVALKPDFDLGTSFGSSISAAVVASPA